MWGDQSLSVILPTYNETDSIRQAVDDLHATGVVDEILVINKAIGNLIRDEKTVQIKSAIQTGAAHGMCLLEQSLSELVQQGTITMEEAARLAEDKKLLQG